MKRVHAIAVSTWDFGLRAVELASADARNGIPSLDVIERTIKMIEDDPSVTNVGYGGLPNERGFVEVDAAIFDGPRNRIGSVAALKNIRNPISVARLILEETPHVMLAADGALQFALQHGFVEEDLLSQQAGIRWKEWKEKPADVNRRDFYLSHDTIALLLRDTQEDLYGGCSTSGLAWKMAGRVGDTALIGSGLYVDNNVGSAAATGVGEFAIVECAAFAVVESMRQGYDPIEACELVLARVLTKNQFPEPRQLALIALRKDGKIGFGCLRHGFQAAISDQSGSSLIDVPPIS